MASEKDLLDTSGIVLMLRNPSTGESMTLSFPAHMHSIPMEVHYPARTAPVRAELQRNGDGEFNLTLVIGRPEEDYKRGKERRAMPVETITRTETPIGPQAPRETSRGNENKPVGAHQAPARVEAPIGPQAPPQTPTRAHEGEAKAAASSLTPDLGPQEPAPLFGASDAPAPPPVSAPAATPAAPEPPVSAKAPVEAPKAEAPKAEAPKAEAPKAEAPKVETKVEGKEKKGGAGSK